MGVVVGKNGVRTSNRRVTSDQGERERGFLREEEGGKSREGGSKVKGNSRIQLI